MKRIFRQLHLWLSVPFGIIVTLICFSGAMLVFEQEVNEAANHDLYYVADAKGEPLPVEVLVAAVQSTLPDSVEVTGVSISSDSTRAYQVNLSKPRRAAVSVDQYTGQVKGRIERSAFFSTMFSLHRWLLDGMKPGGGMSTGKLVVGISTIVFIIVLITGIVVWWPRTRRALKESLKIPFRRGSHRFWYGLHVAGGMYALIFILAMALTGLTWSFSWYRTGFYALFGAEVSQNSGHGGGEGGGRPDRQGGEGRTGRGGDGEHRGRRGEQAANADSTQTAATTPRDQKRRNGENAAAKPATRPAQADEAPAGRQERQRPDDAPERPEGMPPHADSLRHRHGGPGRPEGMGEPPADSLHRHHGERPDGAERPHDRFGRPGQQRPDSLHARPADAPEPRHDDPAQPRPADKRGDDRQQQPAAKVDATTAATATDSAWTDSVAATPGAHFPADRHGAATDFSQWQKVYEALAQRVPDFKLIALSDGKANVSVPHLGNQRASDRYDFDPATGEIKGVTPYADSETSQKLRGWIYSVHVGNWGGIVTRIIAFLSALLGASLPLTGYYLWIKRLMRRHKR